MGLSLFSQIRDGTGLGIVTPVLPSPALIRLYFKNNFYYFILYFNINNNNNNIFK